MCPINPNTLKRDEKYKALNEVKLIKEKLNGDIKVIYYADGSRQRYHMSEEIYVYYVMLKLT